MQLVPGKRKVLAFRGMEDCYNIQKGNPKQTMSVLATISADGDILPPFLIFPYKRSQSWMTEENSFPFTLTDSGWMKTDAFCSFLTDQFIPELKKRDVTFPVLLFLDGHRSHVNLDVTDLCMENEIVLYCFPPNSTHILQPADVGLFKPLKDKWRVTTSSWLRENPSEHISMRNLPSILSNVWTSLVPSYAKNGFRACGLYPWDPEATK